MEDASFSCPELNLKIDGVRVALEGVVALNLPQEKTISRPDDLGSRSWRTAEKPHG